MDPCALWTETHVIAVWPRAPETFGPFVIPQNYSREHSFSPSAPHSPQPPPHPLSVLPLSSVVSAAATLVELLSYTLIFIPLLLLGSVILPLCYQLGLLDY